MLHKYIGAVSGTFPGKHLAFGALHLVEYPRLGKEQKVYLWGLSSVAIWMGCAVNANCKSSWKALGWAEAACLEQRNIIWMKEILRQLQKDGNLVKDPCCWSVKIARACLTLHKHWNLAESAYLHRIGYHWKFRSYGCCTGTCRVDRLQKCKQDMNYVRSEWSSSWNEIFKGY